MDDWAFLVAHARESWRRAGKPGRVKAAVSGGADSVALLLALAELSVQEGFSLSCVHVDHGLRPDSAADAAFVADLCGRLGVSCRVIPLKLTGKSEDEARQARYGAMLDSFPDEGDFALALAHHRRDQAETLLLHLLRGSGGRGLSGMADTALRKREGGTALLWRPFLDVPPETLRGALIQKGVSWREDGTNEDDGYLRNFLRIRVLPLIRERLPRAEEAAARCARILADDEEYLVRAATDALRGGDARLADPCRYAALSLLGAMPVPLRRRAVRILCPVALDFEQTEALCRLRPGETMNLPLGWRALGTEKRLHILPPEGLCFPDALPRVQALRAFPAGAERGDGIRVQAMPRRVYEKCVLRTRRPGDVIRPLGGPGHKSLQDYFTDKKVPRPFRPYVPLLCDGSRVIWAMGVGPGEEARVTDDTGDAVLLRYTGFLPGGDGGASEK